MTTALDLHAQVTHSLAHAPIVAVVRTPTLEEAEEQARTFIAGGLELIEITFTVPGAPRLVEKLLADRQGEGPPWIGMGTVTTEERARQAVAAQAEFIVTPNVHAPVAQVAREAGIFFIVGALSPTEIVAAQSLGADLVKVYPLPPVGGPAYLATIRGPLGHIPMLAAGGFGVEEIPAYRQAGARAFGIGAPLLGRNTEESLQRIAQALALARGEEAPR